MDKLIPLEVSIRQHQLEQQRKHQREQMNQRHTHRHFDGGVSPTEKGSAFTDDYTKSVYAKIRDTDAQIKDDLRQATTTDPYHRRRKV